MKIKYYPDFGGIRVLKVEDGRILFCANDVAASLAYKDPGRAVRRHCSDGYLYIIPSTSGRQATKFIDESDVYRLILHTENEQAKALQDWLLCNFSVVDRIVSVAPDMSSASSDSKAADQEKAGEIELCRKELSSVKQELEDLKNKLVAQSSDREKQDEENAIGLEDFCQLLYENMPKKVTLGEWVKTLFSKKTSTMASNPERKMKQFKIIVFGCRLRIS